MHRFDKNEIYAGNRANQMPSVCKFNKGWKAFLYYIIAPVMRIKAFLFHSGTPNLFLTPTSQLGIIPLCIKVFYSVFYMSLVVFGTIGLFLLSRKCFKNIIILPVIAIVVYTIFIHPVFFGMCEKRYFVPAYPFMLIIAVYAFISLFYRKHFTGWQLCILFIIHLVNKEFILFQNYPSLNI